MDTKHFSSRAEAQAARLLADRGDGRRRRDRGRRHRGGAQPGRVHRRPPSRCRRHRARRRRPVRAHRGGRAQPADPHQLPRRARRHLLGRAHRRCGAVPLRRRRARGLHWRRRGDQDRRPRRRRPGQRARQRRLDRLRPAARHEHADRHPAPGRRRRPGGASRRQRHGPCPLAARPTACRAGAPAELLNKETSMQASRLPVRRGPAAVPAAASPWSRRWSPSASPASCRASPTLRSKAMCCAPGAATRWSR